MTHLAPRRGLSASQVQDIVETILQSASLREKVEMMSGRGFLQQYAASGGIWGAGLYRAGSGCERLGVPPLYFTDGPRGVARGQSTCFPVTMARGATFDTDLERRIGEVMGIEARAQQCTLSGAVCINLLRHPAWGRAQETYGEDSHHLGEMGAALCEGIQAHNVIATVKHFALNSMENARFRVNVTVDERSLREVYLPHFRRVIDAGCASVMSAYNKVNGEYCGEHHYLLTTILREEWGFEGFVHSDWLLGVRTPKGAVAGLDIENPEPLVFGERLIAAIEQGTIAESVVNRACQRILRTQYRFACAVDPLEAYGEDLVASPAHRALALEAAEKSAVLLQNDGTLPLQRPAIRSLAVLGRLAALENTGDQGSSAVRSRLVVTPLAGIEAAIGGASRVLTGDERDIPAAVAAARAADAVVVVAGYTAEEEGEYIPADLAAGIGGALGNAVAAAVKDSGPAQAASRGGDRQSLELPPAQVELIEALAATGKPLVVVIQAGAAVLVERWHGRVNAILQTFYAGEEAGTALARLLFGEKSPSGKLPFSVARHWDDYPYFDREADEIQYDLWHGYASLERSHRVPRFPFGHGLSYASFSYSSLQARVLDERIAVSVTVTNSSAIAADEVVQVYVAPPGVAAERPRKMLKAFARVSLQGGEARVVHLAVPLRTLGWWDGERHDFVLEAGLHGVLVGGSSDDAKLMRADVTL